MINRIGPAIKARQSVPESLHGAVRHIHFIGIGGIGMSGIAAILASQGYIVSGSDLKESPITKKLADKGMKIFLGHDASYVRDADMVVYSSAIKEDNPELSSARGSGILVIRRAEALATLMQDKTCIAVAGSHGKTTTTALVSHLLLESGFCPTVAVGGILRNLSDNSCLGKGNFFVAEADESDGTFLYYNPTYPILTNIDREHLDYYESFSDILNAYKKFISNIQDNGCLFCCGDDQALRQITRGYKERIIYFGLSKDNDFYPRDLVLNEFSSLFNYCYRDRLIGKINLPLSGSHNISNSLAAVALGIELGIRPKNIEEILAVFKGTERRFELKLDLMGVKVIDDYGHHPSEIRATLAAAKNVKHKRLIVIFQPHRFSRTKFLMEEFTDSFKLADYLVLTDIYAASENPIEGVSSELLGRKIKEKFTSPEVAYLKKDKITEHIMQIVGRGDLILTLGAGDIGKLSDELVQRIKGKDTI